MSFPRVCIKPLCGAPAAVTLTYSYEDSTVVIGYLATQAVPGTYDLCINHARRFRPVRGWQVLQLAGVLEQDHLDAAAELPSEVATTARQNLQIQKTRAGSNNSVESEHQPEPDTPKVRTRFRVLNGEQN